MLSTLKSRLSQPLRPSNGYRPWKRPRLSAANGKENDGMLKNRTLDSGSSEDGEERIPVSTKRKELYNKIIPVGTRNIDIVVGCIEEDAIEDLKSNLSASDVLWFVDVWPREEGRYGKESQCMLSSCLTRSSSCDLQKKLESMAHYQPDFLSFMLVDKALGIVCWHMMHVLDYAFIPGLEQILLQSEEELLGQQASGLSC